MSRPGTHAIPDQIVGRSLSLEHLQFPAESAAYRGARNALLASEMALRRQMESVNAQRRALPPGGHIPEDYVFEGLGADGLPTPVKMSELFAPGRESLALYSFMYGPERCGQRLTGNELGTVTLADHWTATGCRLGL